MTPVLSSTNTGLRDAHHAGTRDAPGGPSGGSDVGASLSIDQTLARNRIVLSRRENWAQNFNPEWVSLIGWFGTKHTGTNFQGEDPKIKVASANCKSEGIFILHAPDNSERGSSTPKNARGTFPAPSSTRGPYTDDDIAGRCFHAA